MPQLALALNKLWYRPNFYQKILSYLLWPLSLIYQLLVKIRWLLYHYNILTTARLKVPVIIVGNITVGGTGKTPLTIYLYQLLTQQGFKPGIISRGYHAKNNNVVTIVNANSNALEVGDEALVMYKRTQAPLAIAKNRVQAAQTLIDKFNCNIILSDDGLQHYALARDVEITVLDGTRLLGNGFCLPAGPLREPKTRLNSVDLIIINQQLLTLPHWLTNLKPTNMECVITNIYNLKNPAVNKNLNDFKQQQVHAVSAIGNPERFFQQLMQTGLTITPHPYPDHYHITAQDLNFASNQEPIFMTEKDAVKCQNWAKDNMWVVAIAVKPSASLLTALNNTLS